MKEMIDIKMGQSFPLFLETFVTKKAESHMLYHGRLYPQEDLRLPSGVYAYGCPYPQMIFDSSITGATICSGVWEGGNFLSRASGIVIDYYNARVLSNRVLSNPSGDFSVKEINFYVANENLEKLIIDSAFISNPNIDNFLTGANIPYAYTLPAAIITIDDSEQTDFALGGEKQDNFRAKAVILTEDTFTRDVFLNACKISNQRGFQLLPYTEMPTNESGDLKTGGYRSSDYSSFDVSVEAVKTSKLKDYVTKNLPNSIFAGFASFDLRRIGLTES